MTQFNVAYEREGITRLYCTDWMQSHSDAEKQLDRFKRLYLLPNGQPRPYPNGQGKYNFTNPRIVTKY